MSAAPALAVSHVGHLYGARRALDDVSFTVAEGAFCVLLGLNGAGKSTLLKLMAAIERPSSGSVIINGQNVGALRPRAVPFLRRNFGLIFQDQKLLFDRTAFDNVMLPLAIIGFERREAARRVRAALDKVGLLAREKANPVTLSGGEQQRVAIARALAYNPAVLLMDEPFAALDALTRDDMQRLLAEVWRETRKTVIYVTHNVAEAVYLADRVVVMTPHPGTVKVEVPIALQRPRDPLSVEFLDYQKQLLRHLGQETHA